MLVLSLPMHGTAVPIKHGSPKRIRVAQISDTRLPYLHSIFNPQLSELTITL